jgi:hypothetical protein
MSIDTSSLDAQGSLDVELPVRATGAVLGFAPPTGACVRLSPAFARWALAAGACLQVFQARSAYFPDQRPVWETETVGPIETELQVTAHAVMWWGRRPGDALLFHTGPIPFEEEIAWLAARLEPQVLADRSYLQTTTTERVRDYLGALLRLLAVATPDIPR